jgi:hypothetical protein
MNLLLFDVSLLNPEKGSIIWELNDWKAGESTSPFQKESL